MTRRARAAVVLAVSALAIAGPYATAATASTDEPPQVEVAPNASASSICLLNGSICIF